VAAMSIDRYGWTERFGGGPKQARYNRGIDSVATDQIVTSVVSVSEVRTKAKAMPSEHAALENAAALGHTGSFFSTKRLRSPPRIPARSTHSPSRTR
jgi:hypothetical protein